MISRIDDYKPKLAAAIDAMPHPGLLAGLWCAVARGLPSGLAVYDCGGGTLIAVSRGSAVLLGEPDSALRRDIATVLPFAGVACLYTEENFRLPLSNWSSSPLVCLRAPLTEADPSTEGVHLLTSYAGAAQLVCTGLSQEQQNEFYAEACIRRNRGLGRIFALGEDIAPDGCVLCSGPAAIRPAVLSAADSWLDKLRGMLHLPAAGPQDELPVPVNTVYLSDLVVRPELRNCGLGGALVRAALCRTAYPAEAAVQEIALYCAPEMCGFYETLGFTPAARLRRWYPNEN